VSTALVAYKRAGNRPNAVSGGMREVGIMSGGQVSFEAREFAGDAPETHREGIHAEDYFSADGGSSGDASSPTKRRASLSILIPPSHLKADMANMALQYLPMPVLVLSSQHTVVLANEAMGRLFGIDLEYEPAGSEDGNDLAKLDSKEVRTASDILYGASLAQLGVDLLQNGSAIFVAWEDFLETVVHDASRAQCSTTQLNMHHSRVVDCDSTPTARGHRRSPCAASSARASARSGTRTEVHDAVVDVVFSTDRDPVTGLPKDTRQANSNHVQSQMIISVWAAENEQYFTCTFTAANAGSTLLSPNGGPKTASRTVARAPTTCQSLSISSGISSNSSSGSSGPRRSGRQSTTPTATSGVASPNAPPLTDFPPKGPPAKSSASAPTIFSKASRLKDAILNSMNIAAYAMWKDETFGIPNKAAMRLAYPWIEDGQYDTSDQARDFLDRFVLYNSDFSALLPLEDFPIMRIMRERQPFEGYRVGMYSIRDGSQMHFDVRGETLTDEKGNFLGGLVLFHDITGYASTITRQKEENEQQFENITNMVPQMIWRTRPDGMHDYFSDRWYNFTGLTPELSEGHGWINAFHPDDIEVAKPRWAHSLATGDDYRTEYRCKRADGQWRWMLGRAVPMRDENGSIVKWFGTCTDIHELVMAREETTQMHEQLEQVIELAQVTLWAVDKHMKLIISEGRPMYQPKGLDLEGFGEKQKYLGMDLWAIFRDQNRVDELPKYRRPVEDVLAGKVEEETIEIQIRETGRWFRTRIFPLLRQERKGDLTGESFIDGVVCISMDVTEMKTAAENIKHKDHENSRLM